MNSSDQSKILIFSLFFAPSIAIGVGVIPAIFLGFGIYMMKKNKDFSHLATGIKNFNSYVTLLLIGWVLLAAYVATSIHHMRPNAYIIFIIFPGICIAYLIAMKVLFKAPLSAHAEWIEINGFFATKPKSGKNANINTEIEIIKGEKFRQYSVADELTKWAKLKEDGHISEEMFNEARTKILKRN
ncbi:MAG: SHOCT domain-containing protein [Aeromonas sp.]